MEEKKALIVTTVSGFVPQFERNNVRILQELGYEVHYASNFHNPSYGKDNTRLLGTGIVCHQIDMERSPFRLRSLLLAYRQLKQLMGQISFGLVHCHTPVGGAVARLAAAAVGRRGKSLGYRESAAADRERRGGKTPGCKVIYTVHGFHFYRGAPLVNWLLYYPAERWLARYTDVLITINREDYARAKKFSSGKRAKRRGRPLQVYRIGGVGMDWEKYQTLPDIRQQKRESLQVGGDDFLLLSVGELSRRKNHKVVLKALSRLMHQKGVAAIPGRNGAGQVKYLIAGEGKKRSNLERFIHKEGLGENVRLLGYRTDIREILAAADCFVFPSKQEGMPVALMEAIGAGLPCIAANIRGCRELLDGGSLVKKNTAGEYQKKILEQYAAFQKCGGNANKKEYCGIPKGKRRLDMFSLKNVEARMREIYRSLQ